ncbi:MAG: di-heme oxidoredictase family protein [Bacteroidota bacterium]
MAKHPSNFWLITGWLVLATWGLQACSSSANTGMEYELGEELSAGIATVKPAGKKSFDQPMKHISDENFNRFQIGNSFFRTVWVSAPSSTSARDGLGPYFNSSSCTGCHINDGRGRPPVGDETRLNTMLVRLSVADGAGNHRPHPAYGNQLQNRALPGFQPEGELAIEYEEVTGTYADGTPYTLARPRYALRDLGYGEIGEKLLLSPRVAPPVMGMGFLASIPEEVILAAVDSLDSDGDGISGRPNYVIDAQTGQLALGRFGWKANQPTLLQQNASAFSGDMGLTTSLFPDPHCAETQQACREAISGGQPEVTDEQLNAITAYVSSLGVPARRDAAQPAVIQGKRLFFETGCTACHTPSYQTQALPDFPEMADLNIRPFTDLLLHDMGPELADGRPDGQANGQEWRTPPLWGIGLVDTVNGHTRFLHDGRARNLEEAILWHGGEGTASREAFKQLSAEDRQALLTFLQSL